MTTGFIDAVRFLIKNRNAEKISKEIIAPALGGGVIPAGDDHAAVRTQSAKNLGGIDFNPQNLQIRTSGKGVGANAYVPGMEGASYRWPDSGNY